VKRATKLLGTRTELKAGKAVLVGLGFFILFIVTALDLGRIASATKTMTFGSIFCCCLPYIVLLALILAWTYWVASKSSFVFFWDFRNYWQKTEAIVDLMKSGAWIQTANLFSEYYTADYSMLPAVLPAIICMIFGSADRIHYTLSITAIYTMPAFVTIA